MLSLRRGSLAARFAIYMVTVPVVATAATLYYLWDAQRRNFESEHWRYVQQTASYVGAVIDGKLIERDHEGVERLLRTLPDATLQRCVFYDRDATAVFDSDPRPRERRGDALVRAAAHSGTPAKAQVAPGVIGVAVPVPEMGPRRGYAYVEISTAAHDALLADLEAHIVLAGSASILLSLLGAFLASRQVTRPVARLAAAAGRIAEGDLAVSCAPGSNDELGHLAESFNVMVSHVRDAHGELRSARSHLESVLESIPDAVLVVRRASTGAAMVRIVSANRAAGALLGGDPSGLAGRDLASLFPLEAEADAALDAILRPADGGAHETQHRWCRSDGVVRSVVLSASVVREGGGADAGATTWAIIARDVTESLREQRRKTAMLVLPGEVHAAYSETDLAKRVEDVLRGALTLSAFHLALLDPSTGAARIVRWSNPVAAPCADEATRGLTAWAMGADGVVVLSESDAEALNRRGDAVTPGPFPASWVGMPLRLDGQLLGVVVVQSADPPARFSSGERDLLVFASGQVAAAVGRLRTEAERARLSAAVESAVDAILVTDLGGRIVYANPAFERQTGTSRAVAAGQSLDAFWSSASGSRGLAGMWAGVRAGNPWTGRIECMRSSGTPLPADGALAPVRDAAGATTHFVAIQHDLSHEVALTEQLQQAQKMEAIGILAGGVAHDFNNLLSIILGYTELLGAAVSDPEQHGYVEQITRASDRATTLIQQLLAFSRRQARRPRLLDLSVVVHDLERMLRRLIGEHVDLVTACAAGLPAVEADTAQLEQVLLNLAVNARDAMPRGGTLRIETAAATLSEDVLHEMPGLRPGPHVLLRVSDTGVGMPPDVRARVFEPFFSTKPKGQGTGLGLSTVYGIVSQSGGGIAVDSEPGAGSVFRIYLPVAGAAADESTGEIRRADPGGGTETILVAEDEVPLRDFARLVLQRAGYRVLVASDGEDALAVARAHGAPVDLLLTDVVMPRMSGGLLAENLVASGAARRVLFMSGYADREISVHGGVYDGRNMLHKPFARAALLARVREALEQAPAATGV